MESLYLIFESTPETQKEADPRHPAQSHPVGPRIPQVHDHARWQKTTPTKPQKCFRKNPILLGNFLFFLRTFYKENKVYPQMSIIIQLVSIQFL